MKPYIPIPDADYSIENRFAIIQNDSLRIILRPQAYTGEAQEISEEFFSLYIQIKNTSSHSVVIDKGDYAILAEGIQYDHLPLQVVVGTIPTLYRMSSFDDPFQIFQPDSTNDVAEKSRDQYIELVNNYFSFGKLLSGGVKEGYLFYNYDVNRSEIFKILANGTEVKFSK